MYTSWLKVASHGQLYSHTHTHTHTAAIDKILCAPFGSRSISWLLLVMYRHSQTLRYRVEQKKLGKSTKQIDTNCNIASKYFLLNFRQNIKTFLFRQISYRWENRKLTDGNLITDQYGTLRINYAYPESSFLNATLYIYMHSIMPQFGRCIASRQSYTPTYLS